jgi:hypothetical protein
MRYGLAIPDVVDFRLTSSRPFKVMLRLELSHVERDCIGKYIFEEGSGCQPVMHSSILVLGADDREEIVWSAEHPPNCSRKRSLRRSVTGLWR